MKGVNESGTSCFVVAGQIPDALKKASASAVRISARGKVVVTSTEGKGFLITIHRGTEEQRKRVERRLTNKFGKDNVFVNPADNIMVRDKLLSTLKAALAQSPAQPQAKA